MLRRVVPLLSIACLVQSAAAGAQTTFAPDPLAGRCAVTQTQSPAQQSPQQQPPDAQQRPPARPPATDVAAPPRDKELADLAGVLKALSAPETAGAAFAGLGEGRPFTLQRLAVLIGDVRSIMSAGDARALRERAGQSKTVASETRLWIDQNARAVEDCGPSRFEGRGGPIAFEQASAVVAKHRSALADLVFAQAVEAEPSPPPVQQKNRAKGQ